MYIETKEDFLYALENGPYAWPGGYPLYFTCADGSPLSFDAAKEEKELIIESIQNDAQDEWHVVGFDINWEDTEMYCIHTGEKIQSAYGDDE